LGGGTYKKGRELRREKTEGEKVNGSQKKEKRTENYIKKRIR